MLRHAYGGCHPLSKGCHDNVGDGGMDGIPALIWSCFIIVHVCHHGKCIDRDCDKHLVADECHETKVQLWGVYGGRLGHCAHEDLVTCVQILEGEYCTNCQSSKQLEAG